MPHFRKGLLRLAMVSAPVLALGACDFGYKAGYYDGFDLGYQTKGTEQKSVEAKPAPVAAVEQPEAFAVAFASLEPQVIAAPPVGVSAEKVRPRARLEALKPVARPVAMREAAASAGPASAGNGAKGAPGVARAAETPASSHAPEKKAQPVVAPFAPLRPGPGGGGAVVRVGNTPGGGNSGGDKPDKPDKPDPGAPGPGDPDDGNAGHGDDGSYTPPAPAAPPPPRTQVAKITIVDTDLIGAGGNSQLLGVGIASTALAAGKVASVSLLSGSSRGVDSIAAISVGNAPVIGGGKAPLVSVSALPDLSGVAQVASPVTGAVVATGTTVAGSTAAVGNTVANVPVVGGTVSNVVTTTGNLVGGLLGGPRGKH
jgi:hypothetical protein